VTRTVAVATRDPDQLVLLNADSAEVTARIALPGSARHLQLAAPGGPILVPVETANALVQVQLPAGPASAPIATGTFPHDAAAAAGSFGRTVFVTNEHGGTVSALRGERVVKVFTGSVQPAGVAAAAATVGVLDARRNVLTCYDADSLAVGGSTPAGAGPTHVVADRHGRLIATDTRGDMVRVFQAFGAPPRPREVSNVAQAGGPYGIAYDPARDLLWVASSGTNVVVGYRMGGPVPQEILRIPTVQNPYSLGVDPASGRLFVAGITAGVVQVIDPGAAGG
jgi:DNA-binding beta-propeller fold protein YncE